MIIEDSNALKSWLTSCLGRNIRCDADPVALAKYVLALVKKDKTESELKQFCLEQLEVFFVNPEDTKDFVGLLFETLRTKSYLYTPDSTTNCNEVTSPSNSVAVSTTFVSADSSKLGRADGENEKLNSENLHQSKHSPSSQVKCATGNIVPTIVRQRWDTDDKHEQSHTMPVDDKCDRLYGSSKQIKVRKQDHEQSIYKQTENNILDKSERKSWKKEERRSSKIVSSICKSSSNNHSQSPSSHSSPSSSPTSSRDRLDESDKCDSWRGKKELPKLSRVEYGDTDYRLKDPGVLNAAYHVNNISGKDSKRCQDYDEKGYCMRGDLCLFDHGADPVVVEDVSVLNFGLSRVPPNDGIGSSALVPDRQDTSKSPLPPPPPTSPPPLPPPPPPLPPLPPTGSYIPEPYNPEAPGMNMRTDPNYMIPSNTGIHIPSLHHSSRSQSSGMPNMLLPLTHNAKPPRLRELIGVPTVDVISSTSISKEDKDSLNSDMSNMSKKRKGFDYSRLGPKPKKLMGALANKDTLEVRKIPKHLNTISLLHGHFSKFGTVTNIQVGFQNDPEAALIQFHNYIEANAAYRSTDAVLNNRFIKVLWHFKDNKNTFQTEKCDTTFPDSKPRVPALVNSSYDVNNDDKLQTSFQKNTQDKMPERSVVYSSRGNLSRTIFNPAVLKKTENVSSVSSLRPKDDKKDALVKRLELHKKKQDLLENQIKQQKVVLAKLSTAKSDKEKTLLKKMIKSMETKISALQADVKKGAEELKNDFKMCSSQVSTKTEAEKAWLDAEMDLYNKQHKGDDTAELLSKVNELKQKVKAFGLFHSTSAIDGGLKGKRGSLQFSKPINSSAALLKIDNRPKTLLVSGFKEKEILKKHFLQYGEMEKINETKTGVTVTFSTRKAAEMAFSNGKKLGDKTLILSWYQEEQNNTSEGQKDGTTEKAKDESLNLDADEDEEDEEDSEARSWRR